MVPRRCFGFLSRRTCPLGAGKWGTHIHTVDAAVEGRAGAGAPGTDRSGGGKKQLATLHITMPPTHLHSKVKTG